MKQVGEFIENNKHNLITLWEEEVNKEISVSEETHKLVLRNILPNLLDDLATAIKTYKEDQAVSEQDGFKGMVQKSKAHGRHRATSSEYTVKQMIREHIVLNRVLTRELQQKDLYNAEVGIWLTYVLETSMSHSVSSFSNSLQAMREKLIGTLTHDIRNPVSAALFSNSMLEYEHGEARFQKIKKMTVRSLKKALDLTEELLDAITVRAGEGMTLNFTETNIVDDIRVVYEEAAEVYSNEIKFESEKDEIKGVFDATAVRRITENLISNAVKYGSPDTEIKISIEDKEDEISLNVHNFGEPISSDKQEDIFDFLKRDRDSSGKLKSWGMGLAFVKMATEAHKGRVQLESSEEKGTTFYAILHKHSNKPGKVRSKLNYKN